jgi:inhibitor of the pro-sigma K processing machinery
MNEQYLLYGIVGIIVLFLVIKLLKWPIKIILNGILGVVILYIVNLVGTNFNFSLTINPITALIAGFLGIPGVIVLIIIKLFLL